MRKLESQLGYYQRPLKLEKQTFDWHWRECQEKHQVNVGSDGQSERSVKWAVGHHLPNCLKGITVHSAAVWCSRMVTRIARGRRYGVVSNGKKFHGLYHQAWMQEQTRRRTQRNRVHQQ